MSAFPSPVSGPGSFRGSGTNKNDSQAAPRRSRRASVPPRRRLLAAIAAAAFVLPAAASAQSVNRISDVDSREDGSVTEIVIRGTRTPTFTVYKLERPSRVVVDVTNARLASRSDERSTWNINTWAVSDVSAHAVNGGARVVVRMARSGKYKVTARGNDVVVRVTPREARPASAGSAASREAEARAAERERKAERRLAEAEATLAAARKREAAAARQAAAAAAAEKAVAEREAAALLAQAEAERLREQSVAAQKRAEEARAAAAAARRSKASDAEQKAAAADRAVAAAAQRRADALAAARAAEKRQAEAETSAIAADKRRTTAAAAVREANDKRAAAEQARTAALAEARTARDRARAADEARRAAEAGQAEAEERARRATARAATAEKAADAADRRRQQNEQAAARAAQQRAAEEKALANARDKRQRIEAQTSAAERRLADAELQTKRAAKRHRQAVAAEKRARAKAENADGREADKARADLERLAAERKKTERDLAAQRRAAKKLAAERDQLAKKVDRLSKLASAPAAKSGQSKGSAATVKDISFEHGDQRSSVVIAVDGKARPRVVSARGRKAIVELDDTRIARELERTLDARRFGGPVKSVSSFRDPRDPDTVRIVVDLQRPLRNTIERRDGAYYWSFHNDGRRVEAQPAPKRRARRRARTPVRSAVGLGASTPITNQTVAQSSRRRKVYRGRKIDLDFKDADIHNLLRLLADVGGVNIIIPDEIRANVTVRLRNVPWDQAMEVILASKGLWYRREGTLIRIAPRKVLDAEDKAEAERLKSLAQTEAPEPEIFTLNYAQANLLRAQLAPLLSPKGRIEVDLRTNSLIVNDIRANRRRIIELVSRLDTQTPQVQIEARIVDATSNFNRQIGIQWGGNFTASSATGNATGLIFPNSVRVGGAADDAQTATAGLGDNVTAPEFAVNLPAAIGSGSGGGLGFTFGSVGGNFNLALRLSALEDRGSVRIISSPKITTINNVEAIISSGVSIPISVISANGVQTQFVNADLSLRVTPSVSQRDCSVSLAINLTNNQADFANTGARGDPSITRSEAQTTLLVGDGETVVVGGIYTRNTAYQVSKVPFFGDLPIIGAFFRNRTETDDRSETLIFITPKITNRAFLRCDQ